MPPEALVDQGTDSANSEMTAIKSSVELVNCPFEDQSSNEPSRQAQSTAVDADLAPPKMVNQTNLVTNSSQQQNIVKSDHHDFDTKNESTEKQSNNVTLPAVQGQEDSQNLLTTKSSDTDHPSLKAPVPLLVNTATANMKRMARKRGGKQEATKKNNVCLRYEGNNSKQWDGKIISVEREWIKEATGNDDLAPGKHLTIPWPIKGGGIEEWKAIVVEESLSNKQKKESSVKKKAEGMCFITS